MDFAKLTTRYRQFGGMRLVWQYAKLGALYPAIRMVVSCIVRRESFKKIYPVVLKKVEPVLVERYYHLVRENKKTSVDIPQHEHPQIIWWCWLQGLEQSSKIVKACYESLQYYLTGWDIKIIDNSNWRKYVELPDFIIEKWERGHIPPAMFSDLLRLQLLIKYGGTWIDATVLCTGLQHTEDYLNADLFLFQYTPKGTTSDISISNWFISACANHRLLVLLRDMLHAYWKDYDCVLDYYIFHLFFAMICKEFPEYISSMPYGRSQDSLVLLHHWGEKFDQKKWDRLTERVNFHKLAFRVNEAVLQNKENYYNHIVNKGNPIC